MRMDRIYRAVCRVFGHLWDGDCCAFCTEPKAFTAATPQKETY